MVQKAQIMEDGLEREKRLDNPEDSTVPAKGQGLCFSLCLGNICADSLQKQVLLAQNAGIFFCIKP